MSGKAAAFWWRASETALYLLALLLPLAFFLKSYDSAAVKLTILQVGALFLVFAWLFKGLERGRWELPARLAALALPAGALLLWDLASFALAPYKLGSLNGFLKDALGVSVFLVCLLEFGGARQASRLTGWLLAAGWVAGLYALAQKLGLDPLVWRGAWGARAFSTFGNPDALGLFCALAAPLTLSRLIDPERDAIARGVAMGLCCLLAATALWSGSYEAVACLVAALVVSAIALPAFAPSGQSLRASAFALILAAGAGLLSRGDADSARALAFKSQAWPATAAMIAERPLAGHGPGSFALHFTRYRPASMLALQRAAGEIVESPQNLLLQRAAETGLIGAGLWLWLLAGTLWAAWRSRKDLILRGALSESAQAAGLFAALAGFLLAGQFTAGAETPAPGWLIWALAGTLAGMTSLAGRGRVMALPIPLDLAARRKLYAPAVLALFVGVAFPVDWLRSDYRLNQGIADAKFQEWDKALAAWDGVSPGSPAYPLARYFAGNVLLEAGRPDEALASYGKLESAWPDFALVHYQRGVAYAKLGRWDEALAAHERHAALDPLRARNFERLAAAAKAVGNISRAKEAAYAAIALEPNEPAHYLNLADLYSREKNASEARKLRARAGSLKRPKKTPRDG